MTTTDTPSRNRWLERLAHALPYLLFAAAMLLLDRIGHAATQEEFFKSVQDSVNNTGPGGSGITPGGVAIFLSLVGLLVAAVAINNRMKARGKSAGTLAAKSNTVNQPRKLMKEIARAIREVFDDGSVTSLFDGNA